jgi:hypothetical protein
MRKGKELMNLGQKIRRPVGNFKPGGHLHTSRMPAPAPEYCMEMLKSAPEYGNAINFIIGDQYLTGLAGMFRRPDLRAFSEG